ncbi:MAG: protease modulator HflC [Candidatus Riesia sp.]|nr:protease modulator HflC [Candidatus Riesia sp.]
MRSLNLKFIFILLMLLSPFYLFIVYETDRALIEYLGKLEIDKKTAMPKVYTPGLHFKIPGVQIVRTFDLRFKVLDSQCYRITTKEKKDVLVDFYVLWQIKDLPLYYTRTGGHRSKAEQLLKQKIISDLKAEFGRHTVQEVVYGERLELMFKLREEIESNTRSIGISVIDVRIKRIDLPDEVRDSVYNRMRAERERVASEIRATGRAEALKLQAYADKEKRIILADAFKDAKRIRGEGDSLVTKIYADAYSLDPDFYDFYRTLDAYKNSFCSKTDLLVITPDGDFFKYFKKNNIVQ